ncbi:hypothetical protein KIN20_016654 [Parelaphostrongylus tenuis]|uniref:Uncharacterized protein n=1 Tax=Parelaphostrongylus tenuis TaxID=148309 RepID=A0AAD5N247_PARTN|nr:hypothetical protein KIN20_016654 [Parelaphostrongylus tenuis]
MKTGGVVTHQPFTETNNCTNGIQWIKRNLSKSICYCCASQKMLFQLLVISGNRDKCCNRSSRSSTPLCDLSLHVHNGVESRRMSLE